VAIPCPRSGCSAYPHDTPSTQRDGSIGTSGLYCSPMQALSGPKGGYHLAGGWVDDGVPVITTVGTVSLPSATGRRRLRRSPPRC
jgi:hypothetical protein